MLKFFRAVALVGAFAVPVVGHASNFTFSASGGAGGFNGSGVLTTTTNSGGQNVITGISGTGITGLIAPGGFFASSPAVTNDNLLFPGTSTLVDGNGFAFTDTMGNTAFKVDIFSTGAGAYSVNFLDSDGFGQILPVTLTIANVAATPEPSGLVLLGTGVLGLAGVARRKFTRG